MKVILISHTPNPEIVCCAAAKLCHEPDDRSFEEMMHWLGDNPEHIRRVLEMVIKMGHTSTLEHANFTFYVEGVSRALTHQLVRHRIASYSQQSQRHVKMKEPTYVEPETVKTDEQKAMFDMAMANSWTVYNHLVASGVGSEDARFVLPNACTTKIVITMNARGLHNFFNLRLSKHAQWEIRAMAKEMAKLVCPVAPTIFEKFVKDLL